MDTIEASLRDPAATCRSFNFKHLVLQHHAATGDLERSLHTLLAFTRHVLVPVTPVTDVHEDNRLNVYWLSASLPPANPTRVSFRCAHHLLLCMPPSGNTARCR